MSADHGRIAEKLLTLADKWEAESSDWYFDNRHTHENGIGYCGGFEDGWDHAADGLREFARDLMNDTTHGDPYLSPWQTNPTAGTPEDAAAQLDMAGDLTFNRDDEGEA